MKMLLPFLRWFFTFSDALFPKVGRVLAYFALLLILIQIALIVFAGVFKMGSIKMQESLLYINSLIFLAGAGYTLSADEHVRVDIFYRDASPRYRAWVNFLGCLLFVAPLMNLIWRTTMPWVRSSWALLEGSIDAGGIHAVFLLKSFVLLFVFFVSIAAFTLGARSLLFLLNIPVKEPSND